MRDLPAPKCRKMSSFVMVYAVCFQRLETECRWKHESGGNTMRSLKPIISRSEITELIDKCGELKGFSPAVAEVLKLTSNDRGSIEHVTKAISRDHAIALKILRLANSAVYTRGEPVDSVLQAVLRIGLGHRGFVRVAAS